MGNRAAPHQRGVGELRRSGAASACYGKRRASAARRVQQGPKPLLLSTRVHPWATRRVLMARKSQNTTGLMGTTPASGPLPRPGHGSAAPHRDSAGGGGRNLPRRKVWGSPGAGPGFPPVTTRTNLSPGWVLPRGNSTRPGGGCCCAVPSRNAMGTQSLLLCWMPVGLSTPEHPQKG